MEPHPPEVVSLARAGPSLKQRFGAEPSVLAVLVVLVYFVLPKVVIPTAARFLARRRGGGPLVAPGALGWPLMAATFVAFVVAISWDRDLGRPALGVLLVATLGAVWAMWRLSRR